MFCLKTTLVALGIAASTSSFALVDVTIFGDWNTGNDGTPFADPLGSFTSPAVSFGTDTGFNWHPLGQNAFGAQITGDFVASTAGDYTFGLNSDDGSGLYLDGLPEVSNGGAHGPTFVAGNTVTLAAGSSHPFVLNFFEDFGGYSGVDLLVKGPGDSDYRLVSPSEVTPEPASLAVLAIGAATLLRKRRSA